MKKTKIIEFFKKNIFRKIGWLFLTLGVLSFLPYITLIFLLFTEFGLIGFNSIFTVISIYQQVIAIIVFVLGLLLCILQIVVSINLINKNEYDKKILYFIYAFIFVNLINFSLVLPLKRFNFKDLFIAGLTYLVFIKKDNFLSRFVKNKK
ncbi:MAG: hypothetical protein PHO75_04465 [Candidatus Shapirobacteria bacterium]|jgi:hypothetical protein|nr:hypothetical protein [Candidatus Shapirobacteria bacterium]